MLYKNGFAVCDSIFGVFMIKTKRCLGFKKALVILKFSVLCLKLMTFPLLQVNKSICKVENIIP